ncbi:MAG: DUF86 domain-containing protein [Pseudorhodoplanes sp.]
MPPNLGDRLVHILTAIDDIRALLAGRSRVDFKNDKMLRMAVERLFEVISEASCFIPPDLKAQENQIGHGQKAAE